MVFRAQLSDIGNAVDYIQNELTKRKNKTKDIAKTVLTAEEVFRAMVEKAASPDSVISIRVTSFPGKTSIRMSCQGRPFDVSCLQEVSHFSMDMEDDESRSVIHRLMSRVLDEHLSLKHKFGFNIALIRVSKSKNSQLYITIAALFAGLLTGYLLKVFAPETVTAALCDNVFGPVNTMFLNALKLIVAPLVLFSIAASISEFGDMRALGRVAGKVIGTYFVTSIIAIAVGALVWFIFPIGNPALRDAVTDSAAQTIAKGAEASTSIRDTIVGIIPSDIITPFLKADMLQIIFIAAITGVAAGLVSDKISVFKTFLSDGYTVCSKITSLIISVMPAAVFCSMAKMIISMNIGSLASVLVWIPTIYFGDVIMIVIYGLMILIFARINPIKFFKKFYPVMLTAYAFASSNSTLPYSMETCENSLGIHKRIYAFSLPLGATINMDGTCIAQMVSALFMAKIFGVPVTGSTILTLAVSIFILSVGAPGVPGGALVCISLLLPQIGVPAEAISLIMGLYSIIGMMLVCVNVTGDAVVTLIIARAEKLINMDVFNS